MSQASTGLKMQSPKDILEELIRLASLINNETSAVQHNIDSSIRNVQKLSVLDPSSIPPSVLGLSPVLGVEPATTVITYVVENSVMSEFYTKLLSQIRRDDTINEAVNTLLDKEFKERCPQGRPDETFSGKVRLISLARTQERVHQAINSVIPTPRGYDFKLKLCNFSTFSSSYLDTRLLRYDFEISFHELMKDLQSWTSPRVIPPPLPINHDPAYKYPVHLKYSAAVLERPKDKLGYDLKDGPWSWSLSELQTTNGTKKWSRTHQGLITDSDGLRRMIGAMRSGLNGRRFDSCRAIVIIHSQDQVALLRWQHSTQFMKKQVADFASSWGLHDSDWATHELKEKSVAEQ